MLHRPTTLAARVAACQTNADFAALRGECTDAVVQSTAAKRIVIAGPGTGKTFLFERVLRSHVHRGLVLTFLSGLVGDLKTRLSSFADVFTFHAFCKRRLHLLRGAGLGVGFEYYPELFLVLEADFTVLGYDRGPGIERSFYDLDDSHSVITRAIAQGGYYKAASHTDCVYRVLRRFQSRPNDVPRYPVVVVDEYQDFNALETQFIEVLGGRSPLLVAGDDDQALYVFKRARPDAIRALAADGDCERFELPFCSRCTSAMVQAANAVVSTAVAEGLLGNRVPKLFKPFPPDKGEDSQRYPLIIDARCTVQSSRAPYMGKYVERAISSIPAAHVTDAASKGEPTVLVIGTKPYIKQVHDYLVAHGIASTLKSSPKPTVHLLDGLRFLADDAESRLGWRVVLHIDPPDDCDTILKETLTAGVELAGAIPAGYKRGKLRLAEAIARLRGGQALSPRTAATLETTLGRPLADITALLERRDDEPDDNTETQDADRLHVLCTSFQGAKGLAAQHVFIVGMNDGHFPYRSGRPTELEVCEFIVALTRGRRQCHVVSCRNFAGKWLDPSPFLTWITDHSRPVRVDKAYFS